MCYRKKHFRFLSVSVLVFSLTLVGCSKDEILDQYNNVIQSAGNKGMAWMVSKTSSMIEAMRQNDINVVQSVRFAHAVEILSGRPLKPEMMGLRFMVPLC